MLSVVFVPVSIKLTENGIHTRERTFKDSKVLFCLLMLFLAKKKQGLVGH